MTDNYPDDLAEFGPDTLMTRMGIAVRSVSATMVVGTMPVAGNTQPHGLLHGGASAVLAETLGSLGAAVHAGAGRVAVGVDLNITHHRSVREGSVTGVATALHLGQSSASYQIAITDADGRTVASARLTCALLDR